MSVRKDHQGRSIVDVYWPDGIRTRRAMPDAVTAVKINKKIEVALADEERIWRKLRKELRLDGMGQVETFSDFATRYFDEYVKVYNRDIRVKKSRLNGLRAYFDKKPLSSISLQLVSQFFASKKREGAKNATINRYRALLKHMMSWAMSQGIIDVNPLANLEKLREAEWVGARPDESLIDAIFSKLDSRVIPIFSFLRETGCRRAEAIALKPSQVDYARGIVTFHGNTKSGKSRQVPMDDKCLWSVQALPAGVANTVFYHPDHLKTWTGDGLAVFWDKARENFTDADLKAKCSALRIHDLRHSYAIRLAENGAHMHHISEVMGHHSIDFTRKRYARFSPESASRAVLRVLQGRKADPDAATGTK